MSKIEFKKGFFECIAAADAEKVHSQTIGWILSDECGVFTQEERKSILQELLLGQHVNFDIGRIKSVDVEINDIDIQITCDNCLIVIENKLKSSQHSNQLFKYEYLTANNEEEARHSFLQWKFPIEFKQWKKDNRGLEDKGEDFSNRFFRSLQDNEENKKVRNKFNWVENKNRKDKIFYFYLTLGDEYPKGTEGKWINIKYFDLCGVLDTKLQGVKEGSANYFIVEEYIDSLNRLTTATELFLKGDPVLSFVFTEGKKKKDINILITDLKSYIQKLQLETILQKSFYTNVLNGVEHELKDSKYKPKSSQVTETRGIAALDYFFEDVIIENITYISVLQFQGKAIKLGLTEIGVFHNGKVSPNAEIRLKDCRKNQFAKKLFESETFKKFFEPPGIKETEIKNKLSNPQREFGLMSFPLNTKEFWQVRNELDKVKFVTIYIEQAHNVFKEISDKKD